MDTYEKEYLRLLNPCVGYDDSKKLEDYLTGKELPELNFMGFLYQVFSDRELMSYTETTPRGFYLTEHSNFVQYQKMKSPFDSTGLYIPELRIRLKEKPDKEFPILDFESIHFTLKQEYKDAITPTRIMKSFQESSFQDLFTLRNAIYNTRDGLKINLTDNFQVRKFLNKVMFYFWNSAKAFILGDSNKEPFLAGEVLKVFADEGSLLLNQLPYRTEPARFTFKNLATAFYNISQKYPELRDENINMLDLISGKTFKIIDHEKFTIRHYTLSNYDLEICRNVHKITHQWGYNEKNAPNKIHWIPVYNRKYLWISSIKRNYLKYPERELYYKPITKGVFEQWFGTERYVVIE